MAALIEDTAPLVSLDEPMDMVASTQAIMGSLDPNEDFDSDKDEKNRPRADSDLVAADHALGQVASPAGKDQDVEAKYLDDDGNLEPSVQELESVVGKEVTTDYGKAKVEKVEEIAGELFLVIKYEDGSEENIKYDELHLIQASPKKSSSSTKSTSTKKQATEKKAAPKASPATKKTIAKPAAKKTVAVKVAKPAKKTVIAKVAAKKTTAKAPKVAAKKTTAKAPKVAAKKTMAKAPKVAAKTTKKTTGKR
jgi:hypothetical protein